LSRQQLTAIVELLLGSTVTEAAEKARVDRTTVHRWLSSDALFVATLNQLKQEEVDAIRSRMRSAAVTAVETVEELIEGDNVGTISRRNFLSGQLFPQFVRGQLEELAETHPG
jgi:hypothetical protein